MDLKTRTGTWVAALAVCAGLGLSQAASAQTYTTSPSPGSVVYINAGATRVDGIGCDDCTSAVTIPFSFNLYANPYTTANVDSNGFIDFTTSYTSGFFTPNCPMAGVSQPTGPAIFPHWDDLRTDILASSGIFTSTVGVSPNRTFVIEWRASYYHDAAGNVATSATAISLNFEVLLYEGQVYFDVVYNNVPNLGAQQPVGYAGCTAGTQANGTATGLGVTNYVNGATPCHTAGYVNNGQAVRYTFVPPGAGACCAPNGTCVDTSGICIAPSLFQGVGTTCAHALCPNPVSACCNNTTGACVFTPGATCGAGSTLRGTVCSPTPCIGACCLPSGACTDGDLGACVAPNLPQGLGSACAHALCPNPVTACCNTTTFACTFVNGLTCAAGSNVTGTAGSGVCSPSPCLGACCAINGVCAVSNLAACTSPSLPQTLGSTCAAGNTCPVTVSACCNTTTGVCTYITGTTCAAGSANQGAGSFCSPSPCPPSGKCCSSTFACSVTIQTGCPVGGTWTLGGTCATNCYSGLMSQCQNFDTTTAGTLPAGWTTTATGGTTSCPNTPWRVVNDRFNSSPNAVWTINVDGSAQQILVTPTNYAAGNLVLDFWSYSYTETTYDGWVVEYSTNGGTTWTDVGTAGWILNGYNITALSTGNTFLGGRPAFNGDLRTWTERTASIPASSGQAVLIRFNMASDSSVGCTSGYTGVYLDDICVYNTLIVNGACCVNDGTCAVTTNTTCNAPSIFQGPSTVCGAGSTCPVATVACCDLNSGACTFTTGSTCASGSGLVNSGSAVCSPSPCSGIVLSPVGFNGWGRDVVVEAPAITASLAAFAFDTTNNYAWYENGRAGSAKGMPPGGAFTSVSSSAIHGQFLPYTAPNCLFMDSATTSGTLTPPGAIAFKYLAIFASSANGGGAGSLVINFTDSTNSGPISYNAQDWFNTTTNNALNNLGRISLSAGAIDDSSAGNPRIYQTFIDLVNLGLSTRPVASITFTKPSAAATSGVFAISGLTSVSNPGACCNNTVCTVVSQGTCTTGTFTLGSLCSPNACLVQVSLTANQCYKVNDPITVLITKNASPLPVGGGQFFLSYDNTKLTYLGGDPGSGAMGDPYNFEVYDVGGVGTVDYAVGTTPGGPAGTAAPATMARLHFTAIGPICAGSSLVTFRSHSPATRLTDPTGVEMMTAFNNLGAVTIDSTPPVITCPPNLTVAADAGLCSKATVAVGTATATDNCTATASIGIVGVRSDGQLLTAPYPQGVTTVTWTATDCSGNTASCPQTVTVGGSNLNATVQLANVNPGPFTRCITFDLYTAASCPNPAATVQATMTFTHVATDPAGTATATATITVPCGTLTGITARDPLHTLRRTADAAHFGISGLNFFANFIDSSVAHTASAAGNDALIGGNFNDDRFIEILDFGAFIGQFNNFYHDPLPPTTLPPGNPNTTCTTVGPNLDFNGDGTCNIIDYTYINANFLLAREPDPCGGALDDPNQSPLTDISVFDLVTNPSGGWEMARTADLNRDGRLNMADMAWFGQHGLARCPADFNNDGVVSVQDLFAYINNWFSGYPAADFNDDRHVSVQDIFLFLSTWFAGCP